MDQRIIIGILFLSVLFFPLCTEKTQTPAETNPQTTVAEQPAQTTTTENQVPATTLEAIPLTDLQTEACNTADAGATCESKLKELNIVSLEDCCKYLNKCCA
jgi:hypothetical protein